jgi:RNA polymerase sigma-70 factor, ECF subfamily
VILFTIRFSDQERKDNRRFLYYWSVGTGAHAPGGVGDTRERFKSLYDELVGPVYDYCRRRLGPLNGAAEDVTADVFTVVWRNIDKVPPPPECRTFVYGIAYRQVRKQQQRRWAAYRLQRRLEAERSVVRIDHSGWATSSVPLDRIHLAIQTLPEAEREALLLVVWEGFSHLEAGRVLGCSANAIALRLYKARARIRQQLAGYRPDIPKRRPSTCVQKGVETCPSTRSSAAPTRSGRHAARR